MRFPRVLSTGLTLTSRSDNHFVIKLAPLEARDINTLLSPRGAVIAEKAKKTSLVVPYESTTSIAGVMAKVKGSVSPSAEHKCLFRTRS